MDLVFVHGAADSAAVWGLQVQRFSEGHRTLAVDLPGHGDRLADHPFDRVEQSATEILRLLLVNGLDRPILIGHSMGGAIALTMILAQPAVARGLVLVGSGARLRIPAAHLEDARDRATSAPMGQVMERQIPLDDVVSPHATLDAREWLKEHFGRSTGQAAYADFVATNGFDAMDRLTEIDVPTLVVGGEDDRWTPPKFHRYLAEHIPTARLIMLPDCGHYPFAEKADAFNGELERFLGDVEGASA